MEPCRTIPWWTFHIFCFVSTSRAYWTFHNKPLKLLWSLDPGILSTEIPLRYQNTLAIIFLLGSVCLNFLALFADWACILYSDSVFISALINPPIHHPQTQLVPPLSSSAGGMSRLSPFFELCEHQLSWYPQCRELIVTQSLCDSSKELNLNSRKIWNCEMGFFVHNLVNFLIEFISHKWVLFMSSLIMYICALIPEFPANPS